MRKTLFLEIARNLFVCIVIYLTVGFLTVWLPRKPIYESKQKLAQVLYEEGDFPERQMLILEKACANAYYAGAQIHYWQTGNNRGTTYIGGGPFWIAAYSIDGVRSGFKNVSAVDRAECRVLSTIEDYKDHVILRLLGFLGSIWLVVVPIWAAYRIVYEAIPRRRPKPKAIEETDR